jgi:AraC family transcriptional regulator, regulatory protein of adaptative response / methylated-DNA-[protein]-cysteine methyltransferase
MLELPSQSEMIRAFTNSDASYEGIFITGVYTTGIFCRPTCSARKPKPKPENVTFFKTVKDALDGGFRPSKRCKPLENLDAAPNWVEELLGKVDEDPAFRWRDQDLRVLNIEPERTRKMVQVTLWNDLSCI